MKKKRWGMCLNWTTMGSNLGIGILAGLIVTIIVTLVTLMYRYRYHLRSKFFLCYRMKSAGISNFYLSREDFNKYRGAEKLIDYISTANETIQIAAFWMAHGTEMEGIATNITKLIKPPKKLSVTIVILNPNASYIPQVATHLGMRTKELKTRINSSLEKLSKIPSELSDEEQSRFILKVFKTFPMNSVIILDGKKNDGRIQLEINPYKTPRQYNFSFELSKKDSPLYSLCHKAWCRLIDESESFNSTNHLVKD